MAPSSRQAYLERASCLNRRSTLRMHSISLCAHLEHVGSALSLNTSKQISKGETNQEVTA